jgi:hypothetical protein
MNDFGHPAHRGQAFANFAPVQLHVLLDQCLQYLSARRRQITPLNQKVDQSPCLIEHPRLHRRDQLVAGDEVHLQRQDAEQQIAVGDVLSRHGTLPETKSSAEPRPLREPPPRGDSEQHLADAPIPGARSKYCL